MKVSTWVGDLVVIERNHGFGFETEENQGGSVSTETSLVRSLRFGVPNNTSDISMDGNNCGIGFFNAFAIGPSVVSIQ